MSDYHAQWEQEARERDAADRAKGWHRIRMIASLVGGFLGFVALLFLFNMGIAEPSQGSFIAFHLTLAMVFAIPAAFALRIYAEFLGAERGDGFEIVVAGLGVLGLVGFAAMFAVLALLGVVGVLGW